MENVQLSIEDTNWASFSRRYKLVIRNKRNRETIFSQHEKGAWNLKLFKSALAEIKVKQESTP
jgi:hypothetical protein